MFTGIVEEIGIVRALAAGKLTIEAAEVLEGTVPGNSVAVNGACLTVTAAGREGFSVEVMPETLRRTNLGNLHPGERVNLERALPAGGRFGGHFVQGHIDCTGAVLSVAPEAGALLLKVSVPPETSRYLVEKGFVAVDGASLTVAKCDAASFTVSLVGYSQTHTTLGGKKSGDILNLEVDIMAKYLEKLTVKSESGVTLELLEKHGFLAI